MHQTLEKIAQQIAASGKGILAADESDNTIGKRFATINTPSTEENRRDWRELLFQTQNAMQKYISGVILFDETIRQTSADGKTSLPDLIAQSGALVGIKVDRGAQPLAAANGETITEGLDGLRQRLSEYHQLGARFSKWRAVIKIGERIPSRTCMEANAHALARCAALSQEAGIVPIVEPEVLMDGQHDINTCARITETMLNITYRQLRMQRVHLEGTILKPNMIVSGSECPQQAGVDEVAEKTLACLQRCVPACVPGIAFLSGGQSDQDATAHLNAINQIGTASNGGAPWQLTFSYGRALQAAPLNIWRGQKENVPAAQSAFAHRAQMNSLAALGQWSPTQENQAA